MKRRGGVVKKDPMCETIHLPFEVWQRIVFDENLGILDIVQICSDTPAVCNSLMDALFDNLIHEIIPVFQRSVYFIPKSSAAAVLKSGCMFCAASHCAVEKLIAADPMFMYREDQTIIAEEARRHNASASPLARVAQPDLQRMTPANAAKRTRQMHYFDVPRTSYDSMRGTLYGPLCGLPFVCVPTSFPYGSVIMSMYQVASIKPAWCHGNVRLDLERFQRAMKYNIWTLICALVAMPHTLFECPTVDSYAAFVKLEKHRHTYSNNNSNGNNTRNNNNNHNSHNHHAHDNGSPYFKARLWCLNMAIKTFVRRFAELDGMNGVCVACRDQHIGPLSQQQETPANMMARWMSQNGACRFFDHYNAAAQSCGECVLRRAERAGSCALDAERRRMERRRGVGRSFTTTTATTTANVQPPLQPQPQELPLHQARTTPAQRKTNIAWMNYHIRFASPDKYPLADNPRFNPYTMVCDALALGLVAAGSTITGMDRLIQKSIELHHKCPYYADHLTGTASSSPGMQSTLCTAGHGNFRCSLFPYDPRHPMQTLANSQLHSHSLMWICDRDGGDELESIRMRIELYNAHWRKRLMNELFMPDNYNNNSPAPALHKQLRTPGGGDPTGTTATTTTTTTTAATSALPSWLRASSSSSFPASPRLRVFCC